MHAQCIVFTSRVCLLLCPLGGASHRKISSSKDWSHPRRRPPAMRDDINRSRLQMYVCRWNFFTAVSRVVYTIGYSKIVEDSRQTTCRVLKTSCSQLWKVMLYCSTLRRMSWRVYTSCLSGARILRITMLVHVYCYTDDLESRSLVYFPLKVVLIHDPSSTIDHPRTCTSLRLRSTACSAVRSTVVPSIPASRRSLARSLARSRSANDRRRMNRSPRARAAPCRPAGRRDREATDSSSPPTKIFNGWPTASSVMRCSTWPDARTNGRSSASAAYKQQRTPVAASGDLDVWVCTNVDAKETEIGLWWTVHGAGALGYIDRHPGCVGAYTWWVVDH